MALSNGSTVLEHQLLLPFGDRLKRLHKAQGLGTVDMAKRVDISRTTLSAIAAGDLGPSKDTCLRVMSVLGISGELALLAGGTLQPARAGATTGIPADHSALGARAPERAGTGERTPEWSHAG